MAIDQPQSPGNRAIIDDFDSSKMITSPYDVWKRLQQEMPAIHLDAHGGFWFTSRYADVLRILTDWKTFSSAEGCLIPPGDMLLIPQEMDPPAHRDYRKILNPHLAPKQMALHESWVREEARNQIATFSEMDRFEFVEAFASPFPKTVALRLLGFPSSDLADLDAWITILTNDRGSEAAMRAGGAIFEYLTKTIQERAAEPARDDLVSVVVKGVVDDAPIPFDIQISMLMLLLFGGLHTTSSVLAGAVVWLADHPEDRDRLRSQPSLMTTAIEEFVRFTSPASALSRVVTADTEIAGCPIKKGERVKFGIGAANRDESEFESPQSVDLARYPNRHLGFGGGPHRCVGAHLGKLQVRIGLEEFLGAFSDFEIENPSELRWEGAREARGLVNVPIRVTRR